MHIQIRTYDLPHGRHVFFFIKLPLLYPSECIQQKNYFSGPNIRLILCNGHQKEVIQINRAKKTRLPTHVPRPSKVPSPNCFYGVPQGTPVHQHIWVNDGILITSVHLFGCIAGTPARLDIPVRAYAIWGSA